jgi:hypothetical protein
MNLELLSASLPLLSLPSLQHKILICFLFSIFDLHDFPPPQQTDELTTVGG